MSAARARGLGMGLQALLGQGGREDEGGLRQLHTAALRPSRLQPRQTFDEAELQVLARSIAEQGLLQPLLVRSVDGGRAYEIVAGERRWRAAQAAGLEMVPAMVRDLADDVALQLALVENLQRQDLDALEEAAAYRRLIDEFGHGQATLGELVGRSRSHIANMLRLLALPDEVQGLVRARKLTAGHARALLGAADPVNLAHRVVAGGLSVREAEALAGAAKVKPARPPVATRDRQLLKLLADLRQALGCDARLRPKGDGGTLTLRYDNQAQLRSWTDRLISGG